MDSGWTTVVRKGKANSIASETTDSTGDDSTIEKPTSARSLSEHKKQVYVKQSNNPFALLAEFSDDKEYIELRNVELLALFSKTEIYKQTDDWIDTCKVNLSSKYEEKDEVLKNLYLNASGVDSKLLEQMKIFTDFTELLIRLVPFINVSMLNTIFGSPWIGAVIELFSECIDKQPSTIAYQVESMKAYMRDWRSKNQDAHPEDRESKYLKITNSLFKEAVQTGDAAGKPAEAVKSTTDAASDAHDESIQKINLSNQIIEAIFWYMCSHITIDEKYDFTTDSIIKEGINILDTLKTNPIVISEHTKLAFKLISKIITIMIEIEIKEIKTGTKNDTESESAQPVSVFGRLRNAMVSARKTVVGKFHSLTSSTPDSMMISIIDKAKEKICQVMPMHCNELFGKISDGMSLDGVAISSSTLKLICENKNKALEDGSDIDNFFKLHTELFGELQIGTSNQDVTNLRRHLHNMATTKPNSPDTVIGRISDFVKTAPFKAIIFACLSYNDESSGDSNSLINVLNSDFTKQLESNSDISLNVRVMSIIAYNTEIPFILPFRIALEVYKNPKLFMFCNRVTVDNIERELKRIGMFDDMKRQIDGPTQIAPPSGGGRRGCDISRKKKIMRKIRTYSKKWKGSGGMIHMLYAFVTNIVNTYVVNFNANIVFAIVSSIVYYATRNTGSEIISWIRKYICRILILASYAIILFQMVRYYNRDHVVSNFIVSNNDRAASAAVIAFADKFIGELVNLGQAKASPFLDIMLEQIRFAMRKPNTPPISTPKSDAPENQQLLKSANDILKDTMKAAEERLKDDSKSVAEHKTGTASTVTAISQFDALQHNKFGQQYLKQSPNIISDLNGANEYITVFSKSYLSDRDIATERKFINEGGHHLHALFVFANFEVIKSGLVKNIGEFTKSLSGIIDDTSGLWPVPLKTKVHNFVKQGFSSDTTSVEKPFNNKEQMVEAAQAFVTNFGKLIKDSHGKEISGVSNSLLNLVKVKAKQLFPANTAAKLIKLFTDKRSLVEYYSEAPDVNIAHRDFVVITQTVTRYLHDDGFSRDHKSLVAPYLLDSASATEYACNTGNVGDVSIFDVAMFVPKVIASSAIGKQLDEIIDIYLKRQIATETAAVASSALELFAAIFPTPKSYAVANAGSHLADSASKLYNARGVLLGVQAGQEAIKELGQIFDSAGHYLEFAEKSLIIKNECTAFKISSALEYALSPQMDSNVLSLKLTDIGFNVHYDSILKKMEDIVKDRKSYEALPTLPTIDTTQIIQISKYLACIVTVSGVCAGIYALRKQHFWNKSLEWVKAVKDKYGFNYATHAVQNMPVNGGNRGGALDLMGGGGRDKNELKTRKLKPNYHSKKTYKRPSNNNMNNMNNMNNRYIKRIKRYHTKKRSIKYVRSNARK